MIDDKEEVNKQLTKMDLLKYARGKIDAGGIPPAVSLLLPPNSIDIECGRRKNSLSKKHETQGKAEQQVTVGQIWQQTHQYREQECLMMWRWVTSTNAIPMQLQIVTDALFVPRWVITYVLRVMAFEP